MHSVSIVGCGYTGSRLARRFRSMGASVCGFASRAASLEQVAAAGAKALPLNLDSALAPLDLAGQLVYYSVPPGPHRTGDGRSDDPSDDQSDPRLARFLDSLDRAPLRPAAPARLIYLSTTGVYGDQYGAKVSEETLPAPKTARAIRRLEAENTVRRWAQARSVSWCILRVSGIYGPGRLPLERLRRGEPAIAPEEATPSNRIHVEDLVTACVAAGVSKHADQRIYNVTDGSDDSLTAYLQRVARIAELPPPPLISRAEALRTFTESSRSFLGESRRVENRRLLEELGIALAYHDLDSGIRASLCTPAMQ